MYDSETHQQTRTRTHVLVHQDLLQHLQGVFQTFFSVLVRLSRSNCRAVWAFLRGEGRHSAIYRYRQTDVLSRIYHRRMDQANHNLLMAVGGWGVLLPPCYRTAVLAYHSVP